MVRPGPSISALTSCGTTEPRSPSADVAATVDRMVVAGAGVAGVLSEGAVETPDDLTAVFNLDKPNGNLPVLISIYNPQSLITPADYSDGTTHDARPGGTGHLDLRES